MNQLVVKVGDWVIPTRAQFKAYLRQRKLRDYDPIVSTFGNPGNTTLWAMVREFEQIKYGSGRLNLLNRMQFEYLDGVWKVDQWPNGNTKTWKNIDRLRGAANYYTKWEPIRQDNAAVDNHLDWKHKVSFKDGDIISVIDNSESEAHWDKGIEKKRLTLQQKQSSLVKTGLYKCPFSTIEKRSHFICYTEEVLTKDEKDEIVVPEYEIDQKDRFEKGLPKTESNPMKRRARKRIDWANAQFDRESGGVSRGISGGTKSDIEDKSIVVEPRFDHSLQRSSLLERVL